MLTWPKQQIKLVDFGVAELVESTAAGGLNQIVIGTPNYMAPEFFDNSKITIAADVWAVGCLVIFYFYFYFYFEKKLFALNFFLKKIVKIREIYPSTFFSLLSLT